MGTPPPRPEASPRQLLDFPYSSPEPWSWIPGTWIQAGTVFVTGEGRFYRFVERTDDGWKAEEIEPSAVGEQPRLAEIEALRARYGQVLAAHDALDRKMQEGEDTPKNRALIRGQDEDLHRLRDRLILLCNGRNPEALASANRPNLRKWALVIVLAVVFVVAVANCIRVLSAYAPDEVGRAIAGAAFFLSGTALLVIGVRELAKRKNKLVTGNLVGCWGLVALAVIVAAFAIMCISVLLMYRGAYTI